MGRFRNSWENVKASWRVLRQDKELLVFPFVSGLSALALIALFVYPTYTSGLVDRAAAEEPNAQYTVAAIYIGLHLLLSFITVYFNAALVFAATERLAGGDPTVGSGLRGANARLGKIFAWSLFAGTVGLLIQALERASRRNPIANFLTQLVGVAWTLATFFVIPVLLFEDQKVFASLKRSSQLLRQRWGETLIGNFGVGLVFGIFGFLVVLATLLLVMVTMPLGVAAVVTVLALGAIAFVIVLMTGNALGTIYRAALYRFATKDVVANEFQEDMIINAFRSKL